jgi:transposase
VPFRLLRQEVEARITAKTVEIFHRGKLVATHLRSLRPYRPTTVVEHMPSSHRRYRDWTHERIQREAAAIGADTAALVEIVLRSRPHPEQGFRSCIGILGLRKRYGVERLDGSCPSSWCRFVMLRRHSSAGRRRWNCVWCDGRRR